MREKNFFSPPGIELRDLCSVYEVSPFGQPLGPLSSRRRKKNRTFKRLYKLYLLFGLVNTKSFTFDRFPGENVKERELEAAEEGGDAVLYHEKLVPDDDGVEEPEGRHDETRNYHEERQSVRALGLNHPRLEKNKIRYVTVPTEAVVRNVRELTSSSRGEAAMAMMTRVTIIP